MLGLGLSKTACVFSRVTSWVRPRPLSLMQLSKQMWVEGKWLDSWLS